ncbi:MAG: sugar isomerase [Actinobacteria bacterium]|jgi:fructoselysine-6-P-deglycase FrlB-like protein|nr:MAG: sugar isomerase [Actinomycetota bacterium]
MAYVDAEITSQPECWRQAAELAATFVEAMPHPGERVAVIGCGPSWFMAMAYARLREQAGHGDTDAFQTGEFPAGRHYDRVMVITRLAAAEDVVEVIQAARQPTTVITTDPDSPAAQLATHAVALPFADERSPLPTRFATSALALLRAGLGEQIAPIAADAEVAVRAPLPIAPTRIRQATFLGRGWTIGLAHTAALTCRQAAGFRAESYPTMDFRGPLAAAAPGRLVWAFGDIPDGLADTVATSGAAFVHNRSSCVYAVLDRWAAGRQPLDPMADLILAQRFAVALAISRGLEPGSAQLSRTAMSA